MSLLLQSIYTTNRVGNGYRSQWHEHIYTCIFLGGNCERACVVHIVLTCLVVALPACLLYSAGAEANPTPPCQPPFPSPNPVSPTAWFGGDATAFEYKNPVQLKSMAGYVVCTTSTSTSMPHLIQSIPQPAFPGVMCERERERERARERERMRERMRAHCLVVWCSSTAQPVPRNEPPL